MSAHKVVLTRLLHYAPSRESERGFTMPELLVTVLVMGTLFAIAATSWHSLTESRRVDSATNQFAADKRLAQSMASNQPADWRVVRNPNREIEGAGADYALVKLGSSGNPIGSSTISRTLPNDTLLDSATLLGATRAVQFVPEVFASAVGTVSLGGAATDGCPSGTPATGPRLTITVGNRPLHCMTFTTATSSMKVD